MPRAGYEGQRYEVRYIDVDTKEVKVFGWTNSITSEPFVQSINLNPLMESPEVVDLHPLLKKYPDFCCEDCQEKSYGFLVKEHWHSSFKDLGEDAKCGVCGEHKDIEECHRLGYPFFYRFVEPSWSWLDSGD